MEPIFAYPKGALTGKKIRNLRISQNLGLSDLANKLAIDPTDLDNIETGNYQATPSDLNEIRIALRLEPEIFQNLYQTAALDYLANMGWEEKYLFPNHNRSEPESQNSSDEEAR